MLWCADERTLVFGLTGEAPRSGPRQAGRRPGTLAGRGANAVGEAAAIGGAGVGRRLCRGLAQDRRGRICCRRKDADLLGHVHGFAVQLQAEQPTTLLASLQCDNADAAQALEKRLLAAKPAPDADWKAAHEGSWLTLQLRGDPAAFFKDLGK